MSIQVFTANTITDQIFFDPSVTFAAGLLRFIGLVVTESSVEANVEYAMRALTATSMRFLINQNTMNGVTVITLRRNGVDTGIVLSIGIGATGTFTANGSVVYADEDLISISFDTTASGGGTIAANTRGDVTVVRSG